MSDRKWINELRVLQAKQAGRDVTGERALRLSMAELWGHLRSCPNEIAIAFRQLPEEALVAGAELKRKALAEGLISWGPAKDATEFAREVGSQLWALDTELADRPGFINPPAGPNGYLCRETDVFVIPRRDAKTLDGRTGPGRGFGRRGTPHHRILPRLIDEYEVRLVWEPRLSAGRIGGQSHNMGAALLPKMELLPDPEQPMWIALSADCPEDGATISRQVQGCYDDGAFVMVYPELSMPEARRKLLSGALEARSRQMEVGKGPAFVAAGSWHDRDADGVRNIMRVLDKTGTERMRYAKSSAYFRDGVEEGIVLDKVIPVLVNTDFLATFAICLDFCERELPTPYDRLDVDLILVASYGNAQTMKGHEANAGDFRTKLGGQTFVVQHSDTCPNPVGYVLPAPTEGGPHVEDREWSTRSVRFS